MTALHVIIQSGAITILLSGLVMPMATRTVPLNIMFIRIATTWISIATLLLEFTT